MSEALWRWPARRLPTAIRNGAVSASEAVASSLERVQAVNPALIAISICSPMKRWPLPAAPMRRAAAATCRARCNGVPVIVKVNVDTRGRASTSGGDARDPWGGPAPLDGPVQPRPLRVAMSVNCHGVPADPAVGLVLDAAAVVESRCPPLTAVDPR